MLKVQHYFFSEKYIEVQLYACSMTIISSVLVLLSVIIPNPKFWEENNDKIIVHGFMVNLNQFIVNM